MTDIAERTQLSPQATDDLESQFAQAELIELINAVAIEPSWGNTMQYCSPDQSDFRPTTATSGLVTTPEVSYGLEHVVRPAGTDTVKRERWSVEVARPGTSIGGYAVSSVLKYSLEQADGGYVVDTTTVEPRYTNLSDGSIVGIDRVTDADLARKLQANATELVSQQTIGFDPSLLSAQINVARL